MISLGICIGASTVSVVRIAVTPDQKGGYGPADKGAVDVVQALRFPHGGDPRGTLLAALAKIDMATTERIAATGRKFRSYLRLPTLSEPEAVELAYSRIKPSNRSCPGIISAGGETFMVYKLNADGQITNVFTGNKCAAGTGEFFIQQLGRLGATLDDVARWAEETNPYKVSGRCSVFCKSDCTHATNKGIPKARVASGLGQMMADKILELLGKMDRRNLMLTGGTTLNRMMVAHLRKDLPGLLVPREAAYFEALGAALWAARQPPVDLHDPKYLFKKRKSRFEFLPELAKHKDRVCFKTMARGTICTGDRCLLGLDVGSTTTKAVLIRCQDKALLASVYLRTNGDPVGAARRCYHAIDEQTGACVRSEDVTILGLGVCGSGRQIAGLHAMTEGVLNEITAHAAAAAYFDPNVDTILEIGGQDAKYTHIVNGVPADYTMNEACSAGTGSFLEESARETMGLQMKQIAGAAMKGRHPPNFNDQCAAFIASDIKTAIHDGSNQADIAAGLVYSICMNYINRVKGNRPLGQNVFMQGGVCYNPAVPLAMAGLTDKDITVPPEPGLMGAYGAALQVGQRIDNKKMAAGRFILSDLAERQVTYGREFVCGGGASGCGRHCEIARITIDDQTFPFGGACNRYENLRRGRTVDSEKFNLVRKRQDLIFDTYAPSPVNSHMPEYRGRVGLNRSFLVNTYYPLYAHFFHTLGFQTVLPTHASEEGISKRNAPFCYPAELAHGFFFDLIAGVDPPEYLFLPHFKSIPPLNNERRTQLCPLVQGEPFYLQAAFRERLRALDRQGVKLLTPRLDLSGGLAAAGPPLVKAACNMGVKYQDAIRAFGHALKKMQNCLSEMAVIGRKAMQRLEANHEQLGMVIFARPYNGYAPEAHMGIPDKFASREIMVIPLDFLDCSDQPSIHSMYWGMGQRIMMAAHQIRSHPQLFGTYITNFSCGPDSFIIDYFRQIMGSKPSLTLELDSHSADAGLETRIEAFLDIIQANRQAGYFFNGQPPAGKYRQARATLSNGAFSVRTSDGRKIPMTDPRVKFLFPSMGKLSTEALAAAFRSVGFNAVALPPADDAVLKTGRGFSSCKECLPLILTTGALMQYLRTRRSIDEIVVYFMPESSGPCRFGQYNIFMSNLLRRLKISDVAIFSFSSDDGYGAVPKYIYRRAWQALLVSDVFEDMRSMLLANARDAEAAMEMFNQIYYKVLLSIESGDFSSLLEVLQHAARKMRCIPMKLPRHEVPVISLTGEIYVRRDGLSRQYLTESLARLGFATVCTPIAEWLLYVNTVRRKGWSGQLLKGIRTRLKAFAKHWIMAHDERRIKSALSTSGLVSNDPIQISRTIETAKPYISPYLCGEAILTVGVSLKEVASKTCGVIAIGPFGCMPNRLSEAVLVEAMNKEDKLNISRQDPHIRSILESLDDLPFLAIESDGSPFPQQTEARLEAFCLRAARLHERMLQAS
jgi:predicted CoA-substrate-specific enzyme activase